jgi:hypothetical protein
MDMESCISSIQMVYERAGLEIMKFHAESFKKAAK